MSSSSQYKVVVCSDAVQLQEALRIRMAVFHEEQGFPADTEIDEDDPISAHFLLVDPAEPHVGLGTLRWVPYPPSKVPALVKEAATGTSSSHLPLGRPPQSEGAIAASFAAAGGAKLGRLAISKEHRGKKLGAKLVVDSERWVQEALRNNEARDTNGKDLQVKLRVHSQMPVVNFYKKLGWTPEGPEFDEEGAPHVLYVKTIIV